MSRSARVLLVTLSLLTAPVVGQNEDPLSREGPLGNDTFLPRTEAAQAELATGDTAWRRALEGGARRALDRVAAFEGWRRALESSSPGDAVRLVDDGGAALASLRDPDATHARRAEGVESAVLRRLLSLPEEDRAEWIERFRGPAQQALDGAPYDPRALIEVERTNPLTPAAAVAAVRLADLALEAGRPTAAETWLARARRHVVDVPGDEPLAQKLRAALEQRTSAIAGMSPVTRPEAWEGATRLRSLNHMRLETSRRLGRDPRPIPLGRGMAPGLAFLDSGGLVVQTPRALVWADFAAARGSATGRVTRVSWSDVLEIETLRPFASPTAGGWALRPATDGRYVIAVVGRGQAGRVLRTLPLPARSNHLVCLGLTADGAADVRWHLSQNGLDVTGKTLVPAERALADDGRFEFQPGPLIHEGICYVQARRLANPNDEGVMRGGDLWLFALRVSDGEQLWSRFLTQAADLRRDLGVRGGGAPDVPTSGMPLSIVDGVICVGTNVGIVSAFDAADGRLLWSLRTQRRDPEEDGWPGSRAPLGSERPQVADTADERAAWFAPFDSRFLYALPAGPALGGGILLTEPEPIGRLEDLVIASAEERVFLGRDGRHRALRFRRGGGDLVSSLYLDDGERFAGAALASPSRVMVASDRGLYLFDRERDYLLVDVEPLEDAGAGIGGSIAARGDRVYAVGRDTIWVLSAE